MDNVYTDFDLKFRLWNGRSEWISLKRDWVKQKFSEINVEEIQKFVDKYDKEA